MSPHDVELARRAIDAWTDGRTDELRALFHPRITMRVQIGEVYEGPDAVVGFLRDWCGVWDDWRLEVEQLLDAGDHVVTFFHQTGRGRESGIDIDQRAAFVSRTRDGQIIEVTSYSDRALALKAAGLGG
jgi:ketosteroid isomerase-like protein